MSDTKRWPRQPEADPSDAERDNSDEETPGGSADVDRLLILSRARLLIILFLAVIFFVIMRLVAWQLTPNNDAIVPVARAQDNLRGRIVDRSGLLLATDDFIGQVYVRRSNLSAVTKRPTLLTEIGAIMGITEDALREQLAASPTNLVILANNAPYGQCRAISGLKELNAVWCDPRRIRAYPQGQLAAHLIGFANMDREGVTGVEERYHDWLRPAARPPFQELPGRPEPIPAAWQVYLPSPGGRDLALHLNAALQYKVEQRLQEAIAAYQAESGTIIIMDPRTGGILALANWPTYDLNNYGQAEQVTLRNAAAEFSYEPGSVFKLITYAAALDSGKITPDTAFKDTGILEVDGRTIRNAERKAYGAVTATEALARSINSVSARIALDIGPQTFYRYVDLFGFGQLTEADFVFETRGVVKRWGTESWSRFDQATNSFGQAISVTPLQMTAAVAAIANRGVLLQPQAVMGVVKDGQIYRLPPRVMEQAISEETALTLTRMMVETVDSYSIKNLVPGYRVAGKTGTAEISDERGYTSDLTITSFAGFLPAADPQIVILVKLDKPKKSKWAERVALPVFQQIAGDAVQILKIAPDDRMP